ncbi:hypothetical protein PRK78_005506 [Emydomyces testavorans]|uniref:Uncharacterized protein n=1 Tax=Emydomyces testavorans TaxID=2070801 RepID=A0AAF0DKU4_9EURO|nr:hypothetical protein PRK78_005506 [Emydomyces testavorans]
MNHNRTERVAEDNVAEDEGPALEGEKGEDVHGDREDDGEEPAEIEGAAGVNVVEDDEDNKEEKRRKTNYLQCGLNAFFEKEAEAEKEEKDVEEEEEEIKAELILPDDDDAITVLRLMTTDNSIRNRTWR